MAFVIGDFTLKLRDSQGEKDSIRLHLKGGGGFDTETAILTMAYIAGRFDLLMGAQIVSAVATIPIPLSGVKTVPNAGSECNMGANLTFEGLIGLPRYSVFVPSWLPANFNGDVGVFPSGWVADADSVWLTAGGNPPFLSDGQYNSLNNPVGALKAFRKMRRSMASARRR